MSSMIEFMEIVQHSYEPEEIEACEDWADEMLWKLDYDIASKRTFEVEGSENFSFTSDIPYDFKEDIGEDWDFPDPPEFLR